MKWLLLGVLAIAAAVAIASGGWFIQEPQTVLEPVGQSHEVELGSVDSENVVVAESREWVNALHTAGEVILRKQGKKDIRIKTLGPLGQEAKDLALRSRAMIINDLMSQLEKPDGMTPVEVLELERSLIESRIQLELLTKDEVIVADRGETKKIWPTSTKEFAVIRSGQYDPTKLNEKTGKHGRTVHLTYVLDFNKYPELRAAKRRVLDARYTEGYELSIKFNDFPRAQRENALAGDGSGEAASTLAKLKQVYGYSDISENKMLRLWTVEELYKRMR